MFQKVTVGFVIQNYDDNGNCISQSFIASDEVEYEKNGNPVNIEEIGQETYFPFHMVQPSTECV